MKTDILPRPHPGHRTAMLVVPSLHVISEVKATDCGKPLALQWSLTAPPSGTARSLLDCWSSILTQQR